MRIMAESMSNGKAKTYELNLARLRYFSISLSHNILILNTSKNTQSIPLNSHPSLCPNQNLISLSRSLEQVKLNFSDYSYPLTNLPFTPTTKPHRLITRNIQQFSVLEMSHFSRLLLLLPSAVAVWCCVVCEPWASLNKTENSFKRASWYWGHTLWLLRW